MRSLDLARACCGQYHPGLCEALDELPLLEREAPGSPVISLFRSTGGVGLLVPRDYSGDGAGALDAARTVRGLASYSPSLGAAAVMHHFTAAMLFSLARSANRLTIAQEEVLKTIVPDKLLMASGWAEGRTNQNILRPNVTAHRDGDDWVLNGGKRPCSLSRSMNILTASTALTSDAGDKEAEPLALALVPANTPGITVRPFWGSPVLAAAESDEVVLADVRVPDELIVRARPEDPTRLDDLQAAGFTWFVLLISSVYLGAASELCRRVLAETRGSTVDRAALVLRMEGAVNQLEGVARAVDDGLEGDATVAAALTARYTIQQALADTVDLAVELLGGVSFIHDGEIANLSSATRALAFHPPSRLSAREQLLDYLAGGDLVLA